MRVRTEIAGVVQRGLGLVLIALLWTTTAARADVPAGPPVFTHPLDITNVYAPFQPNGIKVLRGKDGGEAAVTVDSYLTATRTFTVGGVPVQARALEEISFEDGDIHERSLNYFAQADDGTVYSFGEVVDFYEDGQVDNHEGSWLVGGGTLPTDPVDTINAPAPTVFMPANPVVGDTFKREDVFPFVDETVEVVAIRKRMSIAGSTYLNVVQILETTRLDEPPGFKWYAPHVGVIQARSKGELLKLIASTLQDRGT